MIALMAYPKVLPMSGKAHKPWAQGRVQVHMAAENRPLKELA